TGLFVMEAMWTYFLPAVRKAQKWVEEGRIGRLRHIKADFGYPQLPFDATRREYDKNLAGGCLLEMGIYPIALAWLFSEEDPIDVQVQSNLAPNGVEDDVTILFRYNDSFATLGTSFRCKLQNWAYIIGERGYIAIPDFWRASQCYLYELDTPIDSFQDNRSSIGLNFETDAATEAIRKGEKEVADMPLSTSLRFQQHVEHIRQEIQAAHASSE
ncbi:MAG: gfo/Idh/MocA family oxidoreductase, partial [Calditrichota bacterium]